MMIGMCFFYSLTREFRRLTKFHIKLTERFGLTYAQNKYNAIIQAAKETTSKPEHSKTSDLVCSLLLPEIKH